MAAAFGVDRDTRRRQRLDLLPHYGVLAARLGAAGVAPVTTLLGVSRLAVPGQVVELEGTAVA